eukprot:gene24626-biopygen20907
MRACLLHLPGELALSWSPLHYLSPGPFWPVRPFLRHHATPLRTVSRSHVAAWVFGASPGEAIVGVSQTRAGHVLNDIIKRNGTRTGHMGALVSSRVVQWETGGGESWRPLCRLQGGGSRSESAPTIWRPPNLASQPDSDSDPGHKKMQSARLRPGLTRTGSESDSDRV